MSEQNSLFKINESLLTSSVPVKISEFYLFLKQAMCCNKETYNFIEKIIDNTENLRILKNWINIKSKFSELKLEILGKSKPLQKLKDNCCLNIGKTDYTQLCSHIKIALGKIKERYENLMIHLKIKKNMRKMLQVLKRR